MDGFNRGIARSVRDELELQSLNLLRLSNTLDIPEHELRRLDIVDTLYKLADGRTIAQVGGVAFEIHRECEIQSRAMGVELATRTAHGFLVPPSTLCTRAAYSVGSAGAGGNLVANVIQHDSLIDVLRPFSIAAALGVTPDSGFIGNPVYQVIATTTTSQEVAEGSAAAESEGTFGVITAAPHTVMAWNKASRLFTKQVSDAIVRMDIAKSLATEIDKLVFTGTGSSNQPTGLLNTSGIGAVSGTTLAFAGLCTAQTGVLNANGLQDKRFSGWAACPDVASLLAQRYEDATSKSQRLWQGAIHTGRLLNDPAYSSKLIPAATLVFGDFSQVIVPVYGVGVELAVNPYHGFAQGDVSFRAMVSMDVITRHAASFSVVSAIT
ncbi:MAG: phage major capsid protein [Bradyrhizobium sp.]